MLAYQTTLTIEPTCHRAGTATIHVELVWASLKKQKQKNPYIYHIVINICTIILNLTNTTKKQYLFIKINQIRFNYWNHNTKNWYLKKKKKNMLEIRVWFLRTNERLLAFTPTATSLSVDMVKGDRRWQRTELITHTKQPLITFSKMQ